MKNQTVEIEKIEFCIYQDGEITCESYFEDELIRPPYVDITVNNQWEVRNIMLFQKENGFRWIAKRGDQTPLPIQIPNLINFEGFPIAFAPDGIQIGEVALTMLIPIDELGWKSIPIPEPQKKLLDEIYLIINKDPYEFFLGLNELNIEALAYGLQINEQIEAYQNLFYFDDEENLDLLKTKSHLMTLFFSTENGKNELAKIHSVSKNLANSI